LGVAALTVTVAVADFVESVTEVAVMVTDSAVLGAVKVVATPLAVCVGLNDPAVAVQFTPPFALSLLTVAVKFAVPLAASEAVVGEIETEIGRAADTVTVAVADFVGSVTDVAVMVTLPAAPGAVNVVAAPLAVCVGLKDPAVAVQFTPPFALSFATVAVKLIVPPVTAEAVAGNTLTEIGGGVVVTVTVAVADLVVSVTEVAVTVTVPAVPGAV